MSITKLQELLVGQHSPSTRQAVYDTICELMDAEKAEARSWLHSRLGEAVDEPTLAAARWLRVPGLVERLHPWLAATPERALTVARAIIEVDPSDQAAATRLAELAGDPTLRDPALEGLAAVLSAAHLDGARGALEAALEAADPMVRWRAARALLAENGLEKLVEEGRNLVGEIERGGAAPWAEFRASVRRARFDAANVEAFLAATEALPRGADPACSARPQACVSVQARDLGLLRCPACGAWRFESHSHTYLVGGWTEDETESRELSFEQAKEWLLAQTGEGGPTWIVWRPGRAHLSW